MFVYEAKAILTLLVPLKAFVDLSPDRVKVIVQRIESSASEEMQNLTRPILELLEATVTRTP